MLSNNQLKFLRSLQQKKFRDQHQVFTVEGEKIAQEVLENQSLSIQQIIATEDWLAQNKSNYLFDNQLLSVVSEKDLKKISNLKTPNQIFLVVKKPDTHFSKEQLLHKYAFFLDNIQDPGNLGTLWRIADWFGIPYIFTSKGCVDWSNSKVIQSSMGAFLRVKIIPMDFMDLKNACPDLPTYATVLGGKNIHEVPFSKNGILLIGNESKGLASNLQELADVKITIPKGKNGGAESLNAAVATGIVCGIINRFG